MRQRPLSEQDLAIWASYARLVRALPGRVSPVPLPAPVVPPAVKAKLEQNTQVPLPAPKSPQLRARPAALTTGIQPAGLDNATWNRFRGGKLAPSRTIDLHGKTAQAAYLALDRFLHAAYADHLRCVEVITGRGSGEHGGVIRRELPMWLNLPTLRPLVLATAHPHAVNPGSTRLLLRRPK